MPSQALAELSAQIETQETDSFGKFYMYATLLSVLTIRKRTFEDALPEQTTAVSALKSVAGFSTQDYKVKTGQIKGAFFSTVSEYAHHYTKRAPNFAFVIQSVFLTFVNKGQLSDLIFILEKMHEHLHTNPIASAARNDSLAQGISFPTRIEGLKELLGSVQKANQLAKNSMNNAMYGLLVIVATIFALKFLLATSILLTLAVLAASGYAAYSLFENAIHSFERIEKAYAENENIVRRLCERQAGNVYTPNNLEFIIRAVVAPIVFTSTTVLEQMAVTRFEYDSSQRIREALEHNFESMGCKL